MQGLIGMAGVDGLNGGEPDAKRQRIVVPGSPTEEEILTKVQERESYRQARQFAEADRVRDELRAVGVELYDKEKEWKTSDGRRGVLFTAGSFECSLSDAEIHQRVQQREAARSAKDFATADAVRDELRQYGVELKDKERQWMTAGGRAGNYQGGTIQAGHQISAHNIRQLIAERERLRANMDFDGADQIRQQLLEMSVVIYDDDRIWKSADGQQGVIVTGGADAACQLTDAQINARVQQREEARSRKDFATADTVRTGLRAAGVELLDKRKMWVTTDGRTGPYQQISNALAFSGLNMKMGAGGLNFNQLSLLGANLGIGLNNTNALASLTGGGGGGGQNRGSGPAGRVGAQPGGSAFKNALPGATALSDEEITAFVNDREKKRRQDHDFQGADAIRNHLRAHGVEVWDKEKTWRANDGRSGLIPDVM